MSRFLPFGSRVERLIPLPVKPPNTTMADIRISIDRGGTFCDVIAFVQGRDPIFFKLLSDDPSNYADAPTEAVRRVLELVGGTPIARGEKLDGSRIGK